MKKFKERCGAALLEVMISIAMLGLLMVPISSGILMSFRINQRSDEIMQARLAVSSAVETIMAEGVENYYNPTIGSTFVLKGATVTVNSSTKECWNITVSCPIGVDGSGDTVSVNTNVRSNNVRADISLTHGGGA